MSSEKEPIRIFVRFFPRDTDLIAVVKQYSLRGALRIAVDNYCGNKRATLRLPAKMVEPTTQTSHITIHQRDDPDMYAVFEKIPKCNRMEAIRLLIRHATERCELRHLYSGDTPEPVSTAADDADEETVPKQVKTNRRTKPASAKPQKAREETYEDDVPTRDESSMNSVFDFI